MTDAAPPPPAALWEDFLEIFYAPSRVFARRGSNDWGIPLIVLIMLTAVLTFASWGLFKPLAEADASHAIVADSLKHNRTPEQVEQGRSIARKSIAIAPYAIVGFTAVMPVIIGLFFWLVGKAVGAVESLGDAIMISVYSLFPRVIGGVVTALQAALLPDDKLKGASSVAIGPLRFLDDRSSSVMVAMAGRLDLFILWGVVLLAIGLRVKGKVSTGQAAIAAIVIWLLGTLAQAGPALLRG